MVSNYLNGFLQAVAATGNWVADPKGSLKETAEGASALASGLAVTC